MSKKCPHCGHYNTELKISGNIEYVAVQAFRAAVVFGTTVTVGLLNKYAGHGASRAMLQNTKGWGDGINRYHCCNCGNDF